MSDFDDWYNERYWHNTPVTQRGCTNRLTDMLHLDQRYIGTAPLEFPDGASIDAATFRAFVKKWRRMADAGEADSLGGAQCGFELWLVVHGEQTVDEMPSWSS